MHRNELDTIMGDAQFGVTFFTSSQRQDICGTNGLPLTPNSIRILGRSQFLKSLSHPHLSQYVDIIRSKHERIIFVSEYYGTNLAALLRDENNELVTNADNLIRVVREILEALSYLNEHGMVARNLCLENILFDSSKSVKLFNYGVHHVTNGGKYAAFPIGSPKYSAPDVFLTGMRRGENVGSCDVWSLGIIILEILLGRELWVDLKLPQMIRKIASLIHSEDGILHRILQEHHSLDMLKTMDPRIKEILERCLEINPIKRPWPKNFILEIEKFASTPGSTQNECSESKRCCNFLNTWAATDFENPDNIRSFKEFYHLGRRTLKEVYYFWQLAGGDVIAELKRQGLTRKKPAVLSLPSSMTLSGESVGKTKERGLLLDHTVIVLPLVELIKRVSCVPPEVYYPLVTPRISKMLPEINYMSRETESLPLIIREKDIEYQFQRILLFDRLIKGYPYTRSMIYKECLKDIPPFFRAQIWSCLLGIQGDVEATYQAIDKETPTTTDRQIEVDIPRCHQYDELLSSPSGHQKFKRILKAWVVSNKEYVYWQGLDSLSAPFLYLNFNDEAMAFTCLSAFIPKYLYNFFLKDNSAIIQEYLAKFSQLIAFHDPQLTNHLDSIGFIPELYAIPWFLTMFSHVFPLHKIFHLWDKLLLGDSSFSLCIGLSILYQLREGLLSSGFNECILLFSDMPEINIEKCVTDSVEIYRNTPKSAMCRRHEPPPPKKNLTATRKFSNNSFDATGNKYKQPSMDDSVNEALKMDPISLNDLKNEKCPRISGEDVLRLLKVNGTNKPKIIVVDVRNKEDYNRGAIPESLNIPFITAFTPDGFLNVSEETTFLNANKGKIIAVVGNRGDSATKFAEGILRLEYPKVCVLHRGIDVFRSDNILVVPSIL